MLTFVTTIEWIVFLGIFFILISYIVWNMRIILDQQSLQDSEKISAYECGFLPFSSARIQFDIKYFVVAILFLLFDLEIAWIFPFAINIDSIGYYGLMTMLKFLVLLFIGLCYEISTNVLNWSDHKKKASLKKSLTLTNKAFLLYPSLLMNSWQSNIEIKMGFFFERILNNLFCIYGASLLAILFYLIYTNTQSPQKINKLWLYILWIIYSILLLELWQMIVLTTDNLYFFGFKNPNILFNIEFFNLFFLGVFVKLAFTVTLVTTYFLYKKQLIFLLQMAFGCLLFVPLFNELILILLALETANMCVYGLLLVLLNKQAMLQTFKYIEACLKYFCLSSVFAGVFLGFILFSTLLFNNTALTQIHYSLVNATLLLKKYHLFSIITLLTLLLFFVFFKLATFPNHWWAPDVYEGSTTAVFGVLAIFMKIVVFGFFCQLYYFVFYDWEIIMFGCLLFSSLGSLFFGAIGAINQKDLKRFLAYTSMHHMGFIFICLVTGLVITLSSVLFYFFSYMMALTVFYLVYNTIAGQNSLRSLTYISELSKINLLKFPFCANLLIISLASMGGFPPLIGFFSKYFIFSDLLVNWQNFLFFSAVLTSIISAYNYLRIINVLLFQQEQNNFYTTWYVEITTGIIQTVRYMYINNKIQSVIYLLRSLLQKNTNKAIYALMGICYTIFLFPSHDWLVFKDCF